MSVCVRVCVRVRVLICMCARALVCVEGEICVGAREGSKVTVLQKKGIISQTA